MESSSHPTDSTGGRHDDQADALAQLLANPPLNLGSSMLDVGPEEMGDGTRFPYDDPDIDPWGAY